MAWNWFKENIILISWKYFFDAIKSGRKSEFSRSEKHVLAIENVF